MIRSNIIHLLVGSLAAAAGFAGAQGLPDPPPPFQAKQPVRRECLLQSNQAIDRNQQTGIQPYFQSGDKQVAFHSDAQRDFFKNPSKFTLVCGRREIAAFDFSGWIPGVEGDSQGAPFRGDPGSIGTLAVDEKLQTVTFTRKYHAGNGRSAVFTYALKNAGKGLLRLDWDLGLSAEEIAALPKGSSLALTIALSEHYRELGVKHNQTAVALVPDAELAAQLAALPANQWSSKPQAIGSFNDGGFIQVGSDESPDGFKLAADSGYSVTVQENILKRLPPLKQLLIRVGLKQLKPSGTLTLDLGATGTNESPYPSLAGVDFWKSDRTHVPKRPTRNLMPNPSFEQNLRYWTWQVRGGGGEYKPDPAAAPCYAVSSDARFGTHSLQINATQGNRCITSFPMPVSVGKDYTVSFYSKGGAVRVSRLPALPENGKWDDFVASVNAPKSDVWQRSVLSFTARMPAECLAIASWSGCLIDGLQVEEGKTATEFVAPAIEGFLSTADPDNCLRLGQDFQAAYHLAGRPGAKGSVKLAVHNYYRETPYAREFAYQLDANGRQTIPLPLPAASLGTGVFVVHAEYAINGRHYDDDYGRFSVLKYLENKHPSKNIFGIQCQAGSTTRGDDLGMMYRRWGFGSTAYQNGTLDPAFFAATGISNMLNQCSRAAFDPQWLPQPLRDIFFTWEEMTPEREKIVEEIAFKEASDARKVGDVWAFNTESEGHTRMWKLGRHDQFIKMQMAARRGIKRARPDAIVLVDGGTSGFQPGRGYDVIEDQLKASKGVTVWDGLAIHPYGLQDGIDESIAHLRGLADQYQPGANTRLYVNECSPEGFLHVPEWENVAQWYNDRCGRPSYDTGWKEFIHAALSARMYLIGLKYWPRMNDINLWTSRPFMDLNFSPFMLCGATNTLGNLLGNPQFIADYQPAAGIKGLIFSDENHRGLAAVWANSPRVESGSIAGPKLVIKPGRERFEFIDLMGNLRVPEMTGDTITVPLSSAPLLIRSAPGKTSALTAALMGAAITGSDTAIAIHCTPDAQGKINAEITNQTHNPLQGTLAAGPLTTGFALAPRERKSVVIGDHGGAEPGRFYQWNQALEVALSNGFKNKVEINLTSLYVPRAAAPLPLDPADPAWRKIPLLPVTNFHKATGVAGGQRGDLTAEFRVAWDPDNLYLRVECDDNEFLADRAGWEKNLQPLQSLWQYDGCVEVYFDTFANGRTRGERGYDNNDYRYDFYAKDGNAKSGAASVYRQVEVFTEYAGGPSMPTKQEVENGGLPCRFQRGGNRYAYVMVFPQRYLLPLKLAPGSCTGFGLFIHDRDVAGQFKGLSLATQAGERCYNRPDLWPLMILK